VFMSVCVCMGVYSCDGVCICVCAGVCLCVQERERDTQVFCACVSKVCVCVCRGVCVCMMCVRACVRVCVCVCVNLLGI